MNGLGVLCYEAMPPSAAALDRSFAALVAAVWANAQRTLTSDPGADGHLATQAAVEALGSPLQDGAVVGADVRYVNGAQIVGAGVEADPWRPAA